VSPLRFRESPSYWIDAASSKCPIKVRLRSGRGWIAIRASNGPSLLIFVKAPRVPQDSIFSISTSSVNGAESVADNHPWPPLGWRARVGQDDRLEASATVPRPAWFVPLVDRGQCSASDLARIGRANDDRVGGVGNRTLSSIDRAEPSGDCYLIDSIETSTDNSLFTEDIAMTSAVLVLALSLPGQSPQAYPAAQAPAKVAPAPQAPSKVAPAPVAPSKVCPAPQAPAKYAPAPCAPAPAPQAPAKYAPAPAPAPQAPAKVAPAPQAGAPCVPAKAVPQS
jgi:hypothetical protein